MANKTDQLPGILTESEYNIIKHVIAYAGLVFATLGTVTNYFNIKTFIKLGLKDGVAISFLTLSIADMINSIISICVSVSMIFVIVELIHGERYTYDPLMLAKFFVNAGVGMYTVTILQTLYLALTRCICVAMPMKFKDIFTRRKAIWSFVIFNIFSIGIYIPIFF